MSAIRWTTRASFRPSWVFVALVGLTALGGVMAWFRTVDVRLAVFIFVVAGWLVSLCLHEFGHAVVAFRNGDLSVAAKGYLTLNPLKYSHPILSILLPVIFILIGGIGLPGGAVGIDRHAIRSKRAQTWISLVGPAVNLALGFLLTVPFWLRLDSIEHYAFWSGVAFLAFLQITAGLLNLVPLPGLDGGNAMRPWLKYPWDRRFDLFAPYGLIILFALLLSRWGSLLFFTVVYWFCNTIGLPRLAIELGRALFQFWS
jgi:Zn-dependent protease